MSYSCNDCGKQFKFKSKLLEHMNRKFSCKPYQNDNIVAQNDNMTKEIKLH